MTLKQQNIRSFLILILILIGCAWLVNQYYFRIDLTSDKRYTLSAPSRKVLENLDDMVYIKVYLDGEMPVGMKKFQQSIKETLDEFYRYAGDRFQYQFINPSTGTDKQRQALYQDLHKKGILPLTIHEQNADGGASQRMVFPGASIHFKGKELAVNLVQNNPQHSVDENMNLGLQNLEYELIQTINKISKTTLDRIAFIEGHDELNDHQIGDALQMLSEFYTVERIKLSSAYDQLFNYKVLIIAKPLSAWSEVDKFALDQYIMHGGRTAWFIDAVQVHQDSLASGETSFGMPIQHNLDDQLFTYGVRLNANVIQDLQCGSVQVNVAAAHAPADFRLASWTYYPLLSPPDTQIITKGLNLIRSQYPGSIDLIGKDSRVKKQVLLHTTDKSKVNAAPFVINLAQINESTQKRNFNASRQIVGVLLEGEFTSPFRNRAAARNTPLPFRAISSPTRMIVMSDGDLIQNDISKRADQVGIYPLGYDKYTNITYGNKELLKNCINYLADDSQLMEIRSRTIQLRLLDKNKLANDRTLIILINSVLPLGLLIICGTLFIYLRKRKYGK